MNGVLQDVGVDGSTTPAPIGLLSPIKCAALVACFQSGGTLYKRIGIWSESPIGIPQHRISGNTVADLSREGLVTITIIQKQATARLTARGRWFAHTAVTTGQLPGLRS
jgi:hypothetical protein